MIFIDLSVALLASLRALRTQLGEIIALDGKVQSLIDCNRQFPLQKRRMDNRVCLNNGGIQVTRVNPRSVWGV